jgi:predicted porin
VIFTKYLVWLVIAACLLSEARAEESAAAMKPELNLNETTPVIAVGEEITEQGLKAETDTAESQASVIVKSNQQDEALAKMDSIQAVSDDGEDMICDPEKMLEAQVEGGLELAMFNCQKLSEKVVAPTSDERGRGEAESLKNQILQEQGKVEQSVVIIRTESAAETDSEDGNESHSTIVEEEKKVAHKPIKLAADTSTRVRKLLPVKFYMSLRGSVDDESQDVKSLLNDGNSRFGLLYYHQSESGWNVSAQGEWGIRVLDSGSSLDEQLDTQTRLLYAAVSNDKIELTYGKNWGVYYSVASMTDRFLIFGGHSTGVYQAGSDGASSGTGRADEAFQIRSTRRQLEWGLQVQHNQDIPEIAGSAKYDWNYSASGIYRWQNGFSLGIAANIAKPKTFTAEMIAQGLDGDSKTSVIAMQYSSNKSYIGVAYSESENHSTDDLFNYVDSKGWETYYRYDLNRKWRVVAGFNTATENQQNYSGEFDVKEIILGAQRTFREHDFHDMIFVEFSVNRGRLFDGSDGDSTVAIGFRYRFVR